MRNRLSISFPPPLAPAQLAALLATHPLPEEFGPGSTHPALIVRLDGGPDTDTDADSRLAAWLADLACPIIGIGQGALAVACDIVLPDEGRLPTLMARIMAAPITAMVLVQHLRASASLPVGAALSAESMAYATVQHGGEFQSWLAGRRIEIAPEDKPEDEPEDIGSPLLIERDGATLHLVLNQPHSRNAIGVAMRDALCEALALADMDTDISAIILRGAGRCFSVGGDMREFGTSQDPAVAHWVRSIRLPARRLLAIADRLEVRVQGAAIGAGIEMAAFARRVIAAPDAWFQLPEINYGLIPGAGGTVSIPRRIGRQRAAELMLSARRIPASVALEWGLIDAIEAGALSSSRSSELRALNRITQSRTI